MAERIGIHLLWPTELRVARMTEGDDPERVALEAVSALAGVPASRVLVVGRASERWCDQRDLRLCRGRAAWLVVVVLAAEGAPLAPVECIVHDPRAAAEVSMLPGAPFGRPLALSLEPGVVVAVPGWLEWTVRRPLGALLDVVRLDLDLVP